MKINFIIETFTPEDFKYCNEVGYEGLGAHNRDKTIEIFTKIQQTKSTDRKLDLNKRMCAVFRTFFFSIIQENDSNSCLRFTNNSEEVISEILPFSFDVFLKTYKEDGLYILDSIEKKKQWIKKDLKIKV